ncbi:MAG TPA: DNA polymerase III subunit epsilon [Rubrivivax sp.]|nr:DNA polymerase III subunit epsilon [Rubrivivax sp.]
MTRQVFFDTETTGLDADRGDRIVEIGCVEMIDRRLSGRTLHLYLNPERSSHPDALKVHGLTDAFLADKPRFAEIVDELLGFLAGAELVIHNAAFDVGFVNAELARLRRGGIAGVVAGIVDSLAMARERYPGKSNSLDALCRRLEVDNSNRSLHGALLDAGLLAEVYIRMTRGQDSLVIDAQDTASALVQAGDVDLAAFALPVLVADEGEVQAHEALLDELDKSSGGATLWRAPATLS